MKLARTTFLVLIALAPVALAQPTPTDAEIRQLVVRQSIAAYRGSCPCPDNRAANGTRCGARSAYSRAGGAAVLCYATDVSDERVRQYRIQNRLATAGTPPAPAPAATPGRQTNEQQPRTFLDGLMAK